MSKYLALKKTLSLSCVVVLALIFSSCKQGVIHNDSDLPAVLIDSSLKAQTELKEIVSQALFGVEVTLAHDALTKTSLLVVERSKQKAVKNDRIMGRDLSIPDQFRLVKNSGQCILIHQQNGKRYVLSLASCQKM